MPFAVAKKKNVTVVQHSICAAVIKKVLKRIA